MPLRNEPKSFCVADNTLGGSYFGKIQKPYKLFGTFVQTGYKSKFAFLVDSLIFGINFIMFIAKRVLFRLIR